MPLDPSIFLQGAQLRAQNNAALLNSISNSANMYAQSKFQQNKLAAEQGMPEAMAKNAEAIGQLAFYKKAKGEQTTPDEDKLADIYVATQQKYGFNPTTQAPMALPNALENLIRAGGSSVASQGANLPAVDANGAPQIPPQSAGIEPVSAFDLMNGQPVGKDGIPMPPVPSGRSSVYDTLTQVQTPATPANNPAAAQTAIDAATKANVDLQKELQQSDIDASKAGASKYADTIGEGAANQQLKDKGLTDLNDNIDRLIKDSAGTPSGVLQGAAATATSKAGYPNKQAVAAASFDSGKGILGLQSRLAFLKGQGAISNQEATQALSFLPDVNDAAEIKKAKLNKAKEYIGGLMSKAPMVNGNAPGFKYLGVRQ